MNYAGCCPVCEHHALTLLHRLWQNRNSFTSFMLHENRYFAGCDRCGTISRYPMRFFNDASQYGKEYYEVPDMDAVQYIEAHVALHQRHNYEHVAALLRDRFPPETHRTWLDVGSVGYPTSFGDYRFHTLEPSHKAVEVGRRLFDPNRVFQGTLDTFAPTVTYDGILFNNSFYCMPEPRTAIGKCREFLADDGVVVVSLASYLNGAIEDAEDGSVDRVEDFLPGDTLQVYYNEYSLRYLFASEGFIFTGAHTVPAYGRKNMIAYTFKKGNEPLTGTSLLDQSRAYARNRIEDAFSGFERETVACLESINGNDVVLYGEMGLITDLNRMCSLDRIVGIIPTDMAVPAGVILNGLPVTDLQRLKDIVAGGATLRIVVASFRSAAAMAAAVVSALGNADYEIFAPSRTSAIRSLWFRFGNENRMTKAFKLRKLPRAAVSES
jgi:hypothetical protein